MKALFKKKLASRKKDAFRVEALEPRVLLSADPVLGAAQVILLPDDRDADIGQDAYSADQFDVAADAGTEFQMLSMDAGTSAQETPATASTAPAAFAVDGDANEASGATRSGYLDAAVPSITPNDPTQGIVIHDGTGVSGGSTDGNFGISLDDLAAAAQNGAVMVGNADGSHVIQVGQLGSTSPLVLDNTLILANPQAGGEIFINSDLQLNSGASLVIVGSGHTTTYSANATAADDITVADSILINGSVTLTAGTDGTGNLQLGDNISHTLNGNGDLSADHLTLHAPGHVLIKGTVGGSDSLESLTITGVEVNGVMNLPDSVTFDKQVTVSGDFLINSNGTVIFKEAVTVLSGGDLSVLGASNVIFEKGVSVSGGGNILIEGDEISFKGGNESIIGSGTLTLRSSTIGLDIELGTPSLSNTANTLNIDNDEIQTFADGFSQIIIGHANGQHAASGAGNVRIGAINALSQPTLRDALSVYGGTITVSDYVTPEYTLRIQGNILLDAVGSITLSNVVEAKTGGTLNDITLYSATGSIRQIDDTADSVTGEVLRAANLTIEAATGIDLQATEIDTLTATNRDSGDIRVAEVASGGNLQINSVLQASASGSGNINLSAAGGNMTVAASGSGVVTAGAGNITLNVTGAGKELLINDEVTSGAGSVTLSASGRVAITDDAVNDGRVTSGAGALAITSTGAGLAIATDITSAGGLVDLKAATDVTMSDGKTITSTNAGHTGEVRITAGTGINVSRIVADGKMALTAQNGGIVDVLSGAGANLSGNTATVVLAATAGIGSSNAHLQTDIGTLSATNTTSGGIFVREHSALTLDASGTHAIDAAGSDGRVIVTTANGSINVNKAVRSNGIVGHILLQSGEATEADAAGLAVAANITSAAGHISLLADDGIVFNDQAAGTAPTVRTQTAGATIDVKASDAITFEGDARLVANNGNIRLQSGQAMTLGVVDAGTGGIMALAGGALLDAQDDDASATRIANLRGSSIALSSGAGIGTDTAAVETAAQTLAARAVAGGAFLYELDALTLGSVASLAVNRVGTAGAASVLPDDGAIAGLTVGSGGHAVLGAGGNLTVAAAVTAPGAGNVRIDSAGTLAINATVDAGSGALSVTANGGITQGASGILITGSNTIDVASSTGGIAMADGALAQTDGGNIRLGASGNIAIGKIDARTAADRAATALTSQAQWGSVSVRSGGEISVAAEAAGVTDIYANQLRAEALGGIASAANRLDTEIQTLSANAGTGDFYLDEATSLTVAQTAALVVGRVALNGQPAATPVSDPLQSNLNAGRNLVLRTANGQLVIAATGEVSAGRNLLLSAGQANLQIDGSVTNTGGDTTLEAGAAMLINAGIEGEASSATIDLHAAGAITMASGTQITSNNGHVSVDTGGVFSVESIDAGFIGDIRLKAQGIVDIDSDGDTEIDVTGNALQIIATSGVGSGANALETEVAEIAFSAAGSGAFVAEADGVTVGEVTVNVRRVDASGESADTTNAATTGLTTTNNGHLVLTAGTGDLTVTQAVSAAGTGNLLLQAATGTITLDADVDAGAGHVTINGGYLYQNSTLTTTGSGTIDVQAADDIIMSSTASTSGASTIRYAAVGELYIGTLTTAGAVSLSASSVTDAGVAGVNVSADALRIQATAAQSQTGVGDVAAHLKTTVDGLAVDSAGDAVFITETDAVTVRGVAAVRVSRVGADGTVTDAGDASALSDMVSAGELVLQTVNGTVTLTDGSDADALAVQAGGEMLIAANGTGADLVIGSAVASSAGHASLTAGRDVLANASVQLSGLARTLTVDAGRSIDMADDAQFKTMNGAMSLVAAQSVTIEKLDAGTSAVSVKATAGSIIDQDVAGDSETDIVASAVRLVAGGAIGAAGNHIELTALSAGITTLAAQAGNGGMFVTAASSVTVGAVSMNVNHVGDDALTAPNLLTQAAGLSTTGAGHAVLRATQGDIAVNGAVSAVTGNILIHSASGGINLAAALSSAGSLSVTAAQNISQTANGDLTTTAGTIDVASTSGSIGMAQGAIAQTNGGIIRYSAGTALTLGLLDARSAAARTAGTTVGQASWGDVSLLAGGAIADLVSDTAVDIYARDLRISAGGAFGTGINPFETEVAAMSATVTGGGLFVSDASAVTVGSTIAIAGTRVKLDGTTESLTADAAQTVLSVDGDLGLHAAGSAVVAGAVTAKNNLHLSSGTGEDISIGAAVTSTTGDMSVLAGRNVLIQETVEAKGGGKTLEINAGGAVVMSQNALVKSNGGNIAVDASNGSITITEVNAGTGSVRLTATNGSIIDADAAGDSAVDVTASGLLIKATGAVGVAGNALETQVTTLSATSGGAMLLTESDGLTIGSVSHAVRRVTEAGATTVVAGVDLTGLASGDDLVLRNLAGALIAGENITAGGDGNLLLASGGSLSINKAVVAAGSVSVLATAAVSQSGNITSSGGTIEVVSAQDAVAMLQGAVSQTDGREIRYAATGSVTLALLDARTAADRTAGALTGQESWGGIAVTAGTAIIDLTGDTANDIYADHLRLHAGTAIGTGTNALEVEATTLSTVSTTGASFIADQGNLILGQTDAIAVNRVADDGSLSQTMSVDAVQAGATAGGALVVQAGGALTATAALSAGQNMLLTAGTDRDLMLGNTVGSTGGSISLNAGRDITVLQAVSAGAAAGAIDALATRNIVMQSASSFTTANGNMALQAGGTITVSSIDAGTGTVRLVATSGAIADGDAAFDSLTDITAGQLLLKAGTSIGGADNALELQVGTLSARAGSNLFLGEADSITVAQVSSTVKRVAADGTSATTAAVVQGEMVADTGIAVLANKAGTLTTVDRVAAGGNILLQSAGGMALGGMVESSGGNVSIVAQGAITQGGTIRTGSGTIELESMSDVITMASTAVTETNGGAIRYLASGTVTLGQLDARTSAARSEGGPASQAAWGSVSVVSGGSIVALDTDPTKADIYANQLHLDAQQDAGSAGNALDIEAATLSARARQGDLVVEDESGLTAGATMIAVTRVASDGLLVISPDLVQTGLAASALLSVKAAAGSLNVQQSATAGGNVLLQAVGAASDLTLSAAISSTLGSVKLSAGRDVTQHSSVKASGAGKAIEVTAGRAISMNPGATTTSTDGAISMTAQTQITLGELVAGSEAVTLQAGTSIVDTRADGDSVTNVTAASLSMTAASIGTGANHIETQVATLAATAQQGGLFVSETDGVTITALNAKDGHLVLVSTNGNVVVNTDVVASGTGNVLINAQAGALTVAGVDGGSGHVTLKAFGDLAQSGLVQTTGAGTIAASAGGNLTMASAAVTSADANVRYQAGGVLTLGEVATKLDIALAAASVVDGRGSEVDISGRHLLVRTTVGGVGASANAIETAVTSLAVESAGGVYLAQQAALTVGQVGDISVSEVLATGLVSAANTTGAAGITGTGDVGVAVTAGTLTLQRDVSSEAGVTLDASGDLTAQGKITSKNDLAVTSGGHLSATGALTSSSGAIGMVAQGNLGFDTAQALSSVTLTAGGRIDDLGAVNEAGDDVVAQSLTMQAGVGIGEAGHRLGIKVGTLTASAGDAGLFVDARAGLSVAGASSTGEGDIVIDLASGDLTTTGAVSAGSGDVTLRAALGKLNTNAAVSTAGAGNVRIEAAQGPVTIAAAVTAEDGFVVIASDKGDVQTSAAVQTTGNVLLAATAGALTVGSDVTSSAGHLSLGASGAIGQNANLTAGKTLDVTAGASITMGQSATSTAAAIRYSGGGNVVVGTLDASAGSGTVSITAGGTIRDVQAANEVQTVNVRAGSLRLSAGSGVGGANNGNALEIAVQNLGAYTTHGDLSLLETDGLVVTKAGVGVTVARVKRDGQTAAVTDDNKVGVVAPAGNAYLKTNTGVITFEAAYTVNPDQDVNLIGDEIKIAAPLAGQGGALTIQPVASGRDIQIGGTTADNSTTHLSSDSISKIGGGFSAVEIGNGSTGQDIRVVGVGVPVVFQDALVLNASGNGSIISVEGSVTAEAIDARGAVEVSGNVMLSAGNGTATGGNMVFTQTIDGAAGSINDLSLTAGGDSVSIAGAIGATTALDSLTIREAKDVTFGGAVNINGKLVIEATGIVRFDQPLTLNGGTLTIHGASQVIIGDVVLTGVTGPFVIEADSLDLQGTVSGAETIVLKPSHVERNIEIGTAGTSGNSLYVSADTLARLATAGELVFGTEGPDGHAKTGSGKVTFGAIDLAAIMTTAAPVKVFGGQVEVAGGSGTLVTAGNLVIDATGDVNVRQDVVSNTGTISIHSAGGSIGMDAGASVTATNRIDVQAGGSVKLGTLEADLVVVDSGGVITGNAGGTNIVAKSVSLTGFGPRVGESGAVVVDAEVIHVTPPAGLVLQETGPDGLTRFYAVDGGQMYEQAVVVGKVTRVADDPADAPVQALSTLGISRAERITTDLFDRGGSFQGSTVNDNVSRYLSSAVVLNQGDVQQSGLLSASSLGMSKLTGQTLALGSASVQPLSTGQFNAEELTFDYWFEDLTL